jgi:hypothetical protein
LVLAVIGLGLLSGAVSVFLRQRRESASAAQAQGVVVELARKAGQRGYLYYPVVEFTTAAGQKVSFESTVGRMPAGYAVGAAVKVSYDPQNPQKADIDSALTRWFVPGCMAAMGAGFALLGLCLSGMFLLLLLNPG